MQNHDWIDLFRLIPEEQQNTLVVTTHSGVDLSIETILRTEVTYLVFRGRVCGQTDDGRVFFLPYHQIDYLQLNRTVKEVEIRELFGQSADAANSAVIAAGSRPGGSVLSLPNSSFAASASSASSPQVVPMSAAGSGTASRPPRSTVPAPSRGVSQSGANAPAAAVASPPTAANGSDPPQRNSILKRLRAQRNAILPPRPPAR